MSAVLSLRFDPPPPPLPARQTTLWKPAACLGVLSEHFDKVLSVSDKNLLLRQVDRVAALAPDSNATKSGPVRR